MDQADDVRWHLVGHARRLVAVDWDTTLVLDGRIGDYVIVARKQRGAENWFVGAVTDEQPRTFDITLNFLTPGKRYIAEIYADGPGADWLTNPQSITIGRRVVTSISGMRLTLAASGGTAMRFRPARAGESATQTR